MSEHEAEVISLPIDGEISSPEVTVLIPAFNRYASLVRTINSVKHPSCQILVVDDGSEPPVKPYLDKAGVTNVTLVRKPNGGASSARNVGLAHARGKYIAYLDSDDVYLPEKLTVVIDLLNQNPDIDFAFHDISTFRTRDNGEIEHFGELHSHFFPQMLTAGKEGKKVGDDAYIIPSRKVFSNLTSGCPIFPTTVVLRRSASENIGPWNEECEVCGDMEYFARFIRTTDVLYIHKPLSQKGAGTDNLSSNALKQLSADIGIIRAFIQNPEFKPEKDILKHALAKRLRARGYHHKVRKDYKTSAQEYRASLSESFSVNALYNLAKVSLKSVKAGLFQMKAGRQ